MFAKIPAEWSCHTQRKGLKAGTFLEKSAGIHNRKRLGSIFPLIDYPCKHAFKLILY